MPRTRVPLNISLPDRTFKKQLKDACDILKTNPSEECMPLFRRLIQKAARAAQ